MESIMAAKRRYRPGPAWRLTAPRLRRRCVRTWQESGQFSRGELPYGSQSACETV